MHNRGRLLAMAEALEPAAIWEAHQPSQPVHPSGGIGDGKLSPRRPSVSAKRRNSSGLDTSILIDKPWPTLPSPPWETTADHLPNDGKHSPSHVGRAAAWPVQPAMSMTPASPLSDPNARNRPLASHPSVRTAPLPPRRSKASFESEKRTARIMPSA